MAVPKGRLPEDVLEYLLFPKLQEGLEEKDVISVLEKCYDTYLGHLGPRIINYIWQNDGFTLRTVLGQGDVPSHLEGKTNFGDNIDDEWFIVYLMFELSKQCPDLVIRITDNDEEFLLIEAAHVLPKWLNPETAENRVFVYRGDLHIIPIPQSPGEMAAFPLFTPSLEEAITIVRNENFNTRADQRVQDAVNRRIGRFPAKIKENTHYANLYVPVNIAALLKEQPALVSAAVQAFYYRDPVELKVCRTMKHFKPENMVLTRVRFTRCLYAQLSQQRFRPDKRSGWVLPGASNPKYKEQDLGMKLSHGFEILCAKCECDPDSACVNGEEISDIRWSRFLKSLKEKGYFKGELEGSKLYNLLLADAHKFYKSQVSAQDEHVSDIAKKILQLLPSLMFDIEPWKTQERSLPPSDDDSWLELKPEDVDEMLQSAAREQGHGDTEIEELDLQKVAESMNAFVEKVSSIDGAEFPSHPNNRDSGENDVDFDGTSFIHAMQKMFEFKDDHDGSSTDMSEYDWEEESDEDLGSPSKMPSKFPISNRTHTQHQTASCPSRQSSKRHDPEITAIMHAMDQELARTDVGKSFEREPPRPTPRKFQPPPRKSKGANRPSAAPPAPPRLSTDPQLPSTSPQRPSAAPPRPATNPPRPSAPPPRPSAAPTRPAAAPPRPSAAPTRLGAPPPRPSPAKIKRDIDDEEDDFRPVNIDLNTVKNTLESYRAQQGLPGPASNILQSMGLRLPHDDGDLFE